MGHTVKRDHDHQDYLVYKIHSNIRLQTVMRKKQEGKVERQKSTFCQPSCPQTKMTGVSKRAGKTHKLHEGVQSVQGETASAFPVQGPCVCNCLTASPPRRQAEQPTWKSFQAAGKGSWIKLICGWTWSFPATQIEKEGKAE